MLILVTGGSGSGKSAYAEQRVMELGEKKRYYIATMRCLDEESRMRIQRHKRMRSGKGFETVECPVNLAGLQLDPGGTALLECMSNLVANEYFDGGQHTPRETAKKILSGVMTILKKCRNVVIVTNEVFSDGRICDQETMQYLQCLGLINCRIAALADEVTEVVYGIPCVQKAPSAPE